MTKQVVRLYLDPETVQFYEKIALASNTSFSDALRSVLGQHQQKHEGRRRGSYRSLLRTIAEGRRRFTGWRT